MNYKHFSVEEREIIQLGLWRKESIRTIAKKLQRSPSSVSREIKRNFPPQKRRYTPRLAHERAIKKRGNRGREDRLKNDQIREYVVKHLKKRWSPEQIAGRIKIELNESISHEAIYQFIYAQIHRQGRGLVKPNKEDLRPYLRRARKHRRPPGTRRSKRLLRPKGPSIEDRPKEVGQRCRLGDWEGDTVVSVDHKPGINTLVERTTGVVLITKLANRNAQATTAVVTKRLSKVPATARKTLTLDNGRENQRWQEINEKMGVSCFFAHPYSSWERGSNENTNGLIRDYFPKKTDFTKISVEDLSFVERQLNDRPRKRLGYLTPNEAWRVALRG
jgi:transposase, IS30 family